MPSPTAGAAIQFKTLNQLVQLQLDFITANAPVALTKPLGPFITAVCYATGLVALVLQRLVQLALVAARLSTATGADVDSFVADFGVTRLAGNVASGPVTFSRFTPAPSTIVVPVGSIVQTSTSPPVQYEVVPPLSILVLTIAGSTLGLTTTTLKVTSVYGMSLGDTIAVDGFSYTPVAGGGTILSITLPDTLVVNGVLNAAPGTSVRVSDVAASAGFSVTNNGYLISAGASSVIASVQALVSGTSGNVALGAINKIGSPLAGIDFVSNGIAFANGADAESDDDLKQRFALFLLGLSRATKLAVLSAIADVQTGLLVNVVEPAKQVRTVTAAGSSQAAGVITLKLATTVGIAVGDPIIVDGIQYTAGPGTVLAVVDSVTLSVSGSLASVPGAGVGVTDPNGSATPDGTFSVAVDDGSGLVGATLASQITAAVETVRPVGVRAIVIGAPSNQLVVVGRLIYSAVITPNTQTLQTSARSAVLSLINGLAPGTGLRFSTLYKAIFDANSPGDAVSTTIALSPSSTTTALQVASTTGMVSGQLVQIGTLTTQGGALPKILSVDSDTQISLATPLASVPPAGTVVTTFTQTADQILDVHSLQLGALAASSSVSSASDASHVTVGSAAGMLANHFVVITDESVTPPLFYQANPLVGLLPQISSISTNTLTLNTPVGLVNSAGVWTSTIPTNGCKVVTTVGGTSDFIPTTAGVLFGLTVLRCKGLTPNAMLLQMEGI